MEPVKYMGERGQRQEQNTTSVTPQKRQRDWGTERERKRRGQEGCGGRRKEIWFVIAGMFSGNEY